MGRRVDGRTYEQLRSALGRLERTTLESTGAYYSAAAGGPVDVRFSVLTSVSIILMSVTLVAGIYGMNFAHMPELGARYGYPAALGGMLLLGLALGWYFRRRGWL